MLLLDNTQNQKQSWICVNQYCCLCATVKAKLERSTKDQKHILIVCTTLSGAYDYIYDACIMGYICDVYVTLCTLYSEFYKL